jgi:hypothetical protein
MSSNTAKYRLENPEYREKERERGGGERERLSAGEWALQWLHIRKMLASQWLLRVSLSRQVAAAAICHERSSACGIDNGPRLFRRGSHCGRDSRLWDWWAQARGWRDGLGENIYVCACLRVCLCVPAPATLIYQCWMLFHLPSFYSI